MIVTLGLLGLAGLGVFTAFGLAVKRRGDIKNIKRNYRALEANSKRDIINVRNSMLEEIGELRGKVSFLENIRHLPNRVLETQGKLERAYSFLGSLKNISTKRLDWFKDQLDSRQGIMDQMPELLENLDELDLNTHYSLANTELKAINSHLSDITLFAEKTLNLNREVAESEKITLEYITDSKTRHEKIVKLKPKKVYREEATNLKKELEELESNIKKESIPDWIYYIVVARIIFSGLSNLHTKILNERETERRRRKRRREDSYRSSRSSSRRRRSSSSFGGFGGGRSGGGGASGRW